jgi:uncharacterized SAM-binding protein YcdF (DUF218 family)
LYIVPSSKGGATSTFDEAYDIASYLKDNDDVRRIIIVTDGFHTKRAQIAFEKVFEKFNIKTKIQFSPAFDDTFTLDSWFRYENSLFTLLVKEPLKLIIYYFSDSNSTFYKNM